MQKIEESIQYESLAAIWYRKFKFNLLAQNVFSPGLLPFLSCLFVDIPTTMEPREKFVTNEIYKIYHRSLSYKIYTLELPFLWENLNFEAAVKKIDELNFHPSFVSSQTMIKLIGLAEFETNDGDISIDTSEPRSFYAPFGTNIRENHKGIYLWNNPKVNRNKFFTYLFQLS